MRHQDRARRLDAQIQDNEAAWRTAMRFLADENSPFAWFG
jgi:hypothetical protein